MVRSGDTTGVSKGKDKEELEIGMTCSKGFGKGAWSKSREDRMGTDIKTKRGEGAEEESEGGTFAQDWTKSSMASKKESVTSSERA